MGTYNTRPVWIALAANIGIFIVKLFSALISGSSAMFSEALHSMADTFNSLFLLVGLHAGQRPADDEHPFGYGKAVYFWSFIASVFMLGVTSTGSILKGIEQLQHPVIIDDYFYTFLALGLAILLELWAVTAASRGVLAEVGEKSRGLFSWFWAVRRVSRVSNPSIKFVFFEDTVALIGVLLALTALVIVKFFGFPQADGIVSVLIGLLLAVMALLLANDNRDLIIGSAAADRIELRIGRAALQVKEVTDIHSLKTMQVGPNCLLVNMEIEVDPLLKVELADDVVDKVEACIKRAVPEVQHCSIEIMADDNVKDWNEEDYL